jgi:HD superfamily phosphohydrolase
MITCRGRVSMVDLSEGTIIDGKYTVVKKLGRGNAGTVYRVRQSGINVDRAMKVLDPKLTEVPEEAFRREFRSEIEMLSQLTHRNLVKLIDAGEHGGLPYYITDLVHPREGEHEALNLDRWAREVQTKEDFAAIILQLADGLSYFHSRQWLHCDIKPSNLLLEPTSKEQYELKITDLGSSKIVVTGTRPDTQQTHVVGTVDYAPDYVLDVLNTDKTVAYGRLREWWPHWDLFCLGATLCRIVWASPTKGERNFQKMLDDPRQNIKGALGRDFDLLKMIILRLVDPDPAKCFPTADGVGEAFRKLLPEYLVPLGVREMAVGGAHRTLTQPREKVHLSERAYQLVDHPTFQRLHNLNQLNFVYLLYSGAKHSRFLHSLSTYEMAKRYIEGLLGDSYCKHLMYKHDFELFLAAALLHDIGQYPLAHAIEDLGDETFTGIPSGVKTDYQMSGYFLDRNPKTGGPTIADLLSKTKWGMDLERLGRILSRGPRRTECDHLIRSMLDGPLDVDKVSYLLYDSYFTGARYGLGIDLDGFLSSLVAIPPHGERHSQVGIFETGVVAAEGVISARYSMFSRVYWHHFNRAIMAMLKYAAAKTFLSPGGVSFFGYIEDTFGFSDLDAVRYMHDRLREVMHLENTNPLSGLVDGTRRVYRRFLTFWGGDAKSGPTYRLLTSYNFKKLENLRVGLLERLGTMLGQKLEDYDLLFDVPKTEKRRDALEDVYVCDPEDTEKIEKLSTLSGVVGALCKEFEDLTKKCRIYISPAVRDRLEGDERKAKRVKAEINEHLGQIADGENR